MGELSDLIERVERATGADQEIDGHLEVLARNVSAARTGLAREHWARWESDAQGGVRDGFTAYTADRVTASVDAALALIERVRPGWCVENLGEIAPGCGDLSGHWLAQLRPRVERRRMQGPITVDALRATFDATEPVSAPTPALALCLALLRAMEME